MPNPNQAKRTKGVLRYSIDQLLLVDAIRYLVAATRYLWLVVVRQKLRTWDLEKGIANGVAENTIHHNLRGLRDLAVARSHFLARPLSVIESIDADATVLSIGPRSEGELLNLMAHGFKWANISGLDLISYSPRIELGDMHRMPHPDGSFDVVVAGWVIAYSEKPSIAAKEIVRVTRPGGVIAVGVEYSPLSESQVIDLLGYRPGAEKRIASCDDILALFGDAVDHIYFIHDVRPSRLDHVGSMCVVFSIK